MLASFAILIPPFRISRFRGLLRAITGERKREGEGERGGKGERRRKVSSTPNFIEIYQTLFEIRADAVLKREHARSGKIKKMNRGGSLKYDLHLSTVLEGTNSAL